MSETMSSSPFDDTAPERVRTASTVGQKANGKDHAAVGELQPDESETVAMAAEILCTRWTVVVLRELFAGSTRFNELRRGVPRMSPALLSRRLKELEEAGIVARAASDADAKSFEYHLTESGRELGPLVEAFGIWGQRRIEVELSLQHLDADLLMWDMRRNLNVTPMPPSRNHSLRSRPAPAKSSVRR